MNGSFLRYYRGYPFRYLIQAIISLVWTIGFMLPFIALAAVVCGMNGYYVFTDFGFLNLLGLLVGGAFFVYFIKGFPSAIRECFCTRIVPYFEKRGVGGDETFSSGLAIAKNCQHLDALSKELNLQPISHFGFADDQTAGKVVWHEAKDGLKAVNGLLLHLNKNPNLLSAQPAITTELERISLSLQSAEAIGIRFSFILRQGLDEFISPLEMDRRKGTFW